MDQGTAQVLSAAISAVVSLITLGVNVVVLRRTEQVHGLVNGLSHEKDALLAAAAAKEGELRGRDYVADPRSPRE